MTRPSDELHSVALALLQRVKTSLQTRRTSKPIRYKNETMAGIIGVTVPELELIHQSLHEAGLLWIRMTNNRSTYRNFYHEPRKDTN